MVVKTDPAEIASLTFRDLPDTDGEIVNNPYLVPQCYLLSNCLRSKLAELHPDGDVFLGPDTGIYFLPTNPPMAGCRAPDWFYVPGVYAMDGDERVRSYVMWQNQYKPPYLLVELVSGPGGGEYDETPDTGKFWIYERRVKAEYYVIFDAYAGDGELEVFHLENGRYQRMKPNQANRYPIPRFGYELGFERGTIQWTEGPYLRFYHPDGTLVYFDEERVEIESKRANAEKKRANAENKRTNAEMRRADSEKRRANTLKRRAERGEKLAETERQRAVSAEEQLNQLMAKLREQGIDPDKL